MLSVEWNKTNLKKFYSKMDKIIKQLPNATKNGIKTALENTRALAIQIKPISNYEDKILIEFTDAQTNEIVGRLHTDKDTFPHALFVEFGTGIYAEESHIGITRTFLESGFRYWFVPKEKVDLSKYGLTPIVMYGKEFYLLSGQQPTRFMRSAGFQSRENNIEEMEKALINMIREVVK